MNRALFAFGILAAVVLCLPHDALARITSIGKGTAVSCATTATAADDTTIVNTIDRYVTICAPSDATSTVYIGNSTVTTSTGIPLTAGKCWSSGERVEPSLQAYCIVASGTQSVRVLETR